MAAAASSGVQTAPTHSGRLRRGDPRGDEVRRSGESAWPSGAPVLPDRAPWASGPSRCRAMNRRAAGLRAWADGAAAALCVLTRDLPTVRVSGGGGGRSRRTCRRRPGSRLRRACGIEGCLAQRRELECRSHGTTHKLAERASCRSGGRQRGEHVFVKLGMGADGTGAGVAEPAPGFGSRTRKMRARTATEVADCPARRLDPRRGYRGAVRPAAPLPAPLRRARQDEPSDDQISSFVLIFSTTASVNSVVVACPPRSNVFVPPAVVSSVLS